MNTRLNLRRRINGLLLILMAAALPAVAAEREIPPPFGPHIHLAPADFAGSKSFGSKERIVGTYYFYWYRIDTKEHIINPEDGSDGLTDHPPTFEDFSYLSGNWHKKELSDMIDAGIDVVLPVFWGAPSERNPKASLYWSYAGLGPMVQAREQLLREGKNPPRIGLFYDTSTLQNNAWGYHADLTTDYGKRWFYSTVRDFFSAIPPRHWAMIDGKPIVLLYAAAFAKKWDQGFIDYTRAEFKKDFTREPYLAPQDSWNVQGDNICAWGGALGTRNPGIGELGPGYDDTAVYGRTPLIAEREGGKFYERNWLKFLRRPSNFVMIETWNEFHEGTTICETKEYGRQYIELTRKYADLFKNGWTPEWPKGPFTGAKTVTFAASDKTPAGLRVVVHEDSALSSRALGGRECRVLVPWPGGGSGYMYFQADDSFKWSPSMNAAVEVEYFDAAPGMLGIEFDGSDRSAPFAGAYSRSAKVELKGDKRWKRAEFDLNGAYFCNAQNSGADFRLVAEAAQVGVGNVTLKRR
jgi:hypothetical protein